MTQKHVLISGGSTGIGKAMVIDLLKEGYNVTAFSRNAQKCKALQEEVTLETHDENALILQGDLTSDADRKRIVKEAREKFGAIDIIINNAGYGFFVSCDEFDVEEYKNMMDTNMISLAAMNKEVIPEMKERKEGLIINIASIAGKRVFGIGSFYSSTKFALMGYSEGIRNELKPQGIKVATICPGLIKTEFFTDEELEKREKAKGEKLVMLEPQDVSRVVCMICSQSQVCSIEDVTIMPML